MKCPLTIYIPNRDVFLGIASSSFSKYFIQMKINFTTKEESKKLQEAEFLALSGAERVFAFFKLCYEMRSFPSKETSEKNNNFVIEFKNR